ncbi:MAG: TRAP transporter substrate-binding protein DctP [Deltaproteobacteria bacterium]|nr:TRAP transporter substrate-binding protein DctP [Deltaproteobacteria bacterium]
MKSLKIGVLSVLALLLVIPLGSAYAADDTINLTYGASEAIMHTFSKADVAWIKKIEEDTKGRVKITPYWGATLLSRRENTEELIKGVADLGYVSPRTGYDLMLGSLGFPYGVGDWKTVVKIYDKLDKKFPELDGEWSKMKIMAKSVSSNYHLLSRKPVRTVADFKGLTVKATGAYNAIIKELGGEGVNIPMGETYVALQKGTIDACLAPYSTLVAFKFNEVAKYITVLNLTSSIRPTRGMNLDSWNKLPKDIQKIFDKSVEFWSNEDNKWRDLDDVEGVELAKKTGCEFIELSKEDLAAVYKAAEKAMLSEAAKLDAKGLPGTKLFKEVRSLVDKYAK